MATNQNSVPTISGNSSRSNPRKTWLWWDGCQSLTKQAQLTGTISNGRTTQRTCNTGNPSMASSSCAPSLSEPHGLGPSFWAARTSGTCWQDRQFSSCSLCGSNITRTKPKLQRATQVHFLTLPLSWTYQPPWGPLTKSSNFGRNSRNGKRAWRKMLTHSELSKHWQFHTALLL